MTLVTSAAEPEQCRRRVLLEGLYRRYHGALMRFLGRQRLGADEAKEIVQEAYCRMHQVANLEALEFPQAYLFRTASNLARDSHRRLWHARRQVRIDSADIESGAPAPHRILNGEQELELLRQGLMELSPKCRRVFVMNRFDELTYRQIALELDISVSMIEKYVSQALAHLKVRIDGARRASPQLRALKLPR